MNKHRKKYRSPALWTSGGREFRYGEIWDGGRHIDPKSRITLPNVTIQRKLNQGRKRSAIDSVIDLLRDWRFNRWEHEGPVRHGLRQALCVEAWSWQDADIEAADIVRRAFNQLGRGKERRPTEDEADELYLVPIENCLGCGGELTEAQIAMNIRCCDIDCARFVYFRRTYVSGAYESAYGKAAYKILYRDQFQERTCARDGCDNTFKTEQPHQKFCSKACADLAKTIIPERACANPECGKIFRPREDEAKYCSFACYETGRGSDLPMQDCARCGTPFQPKNRQSMYCTKDCGVQAFIERRRAETARRKGKIEPNDPGHPINRLFDEAA